ncbi:MAG: T9SS type A sorting domain-containing protein [Lewinellaceae bacterium]|nr:T9SS type A sorting domain-containing protein [Saprospiraceae bacterium]MCB9345072.1 T9SS type A sorting domain-containing protein [Lewinellaceae bacterium]
MNPRIIFLLLFLNLHNVNAQFNLEWQKALGGSADELANATQQTSDGGFILAGFTISNNNGDVSGMMGGGDFWVVKLNSNGEVEWQKALGGSSTEVAEYIQQTFDGGFIVVGRTISDDGDVTDLNGKLDYWVVKLDSIGTIEWQRTLGGSGNDYGECIKQTPDGGYIVVGNTSSNDGDLTGNPAVYGAWIVKLNSIGVIEWQRVYGYGLSQAYDVKVTNDSGYVITGETYSNEGELSEYHGSGDYWVLKLNKNGEVEWQKALGGEGIDQARSIIQTDDGGYAVTGISGSYNTGQVSGSQGFFDFWIVKLNLTGDIEWQKPIGGSSEDYGRAIVQTNDGGYVVGGFTSSDDGDVKNSDGTINYWVVKLAPDGKIQFQKTFGGSNVDSAYDLQNTTDGGYIIAGESMSNDGDVTGNHGKSDMWVVRIRGTNSSSQNPSSLPLNIFPNPATDQITLDIPEDELIHSVSFRDLLGREILQVEQHGTTINIGSMSKGVYLLQAVTESGEIYTGKLLKG